MAAYQGTYFTQPITLKDKGTGVALDITGWTFKAEFRVDVDDTNPALTLDSTAGGFSIIDAANGRVSMNVDLTTNTLAPGKYQFDVLRTDCTPGPIWLFGGSILVRQPVTR